MQGEIWGIVLNFRRQGSSNGGEGRGEETEYGRCQGLLWKGINVGKCGEGHAKKQSIGNSLEDLLNVTIDAIVRSAMLTTES